MRHAFLERIFSTSLFSFCDGPFDGVRWSGRRELGPSRLELASGQPNMGSLNCSLIRPDGALDGPGRAGRPPTGRLSGLAARQDASVFSLVSYRPLATHN